MRTNVLHKPIYKNDLSIMTKRELHLIDYALCFLNANWDEDNLEDLERHGIDQEYLDKTIMMWQNKIQESKNQ